MFNGVVEYGNQNGTTKLSKIFVGAPFDTQAATRLISRGSGSGKHKNTGEIVDFPRLRNYIHVVNANGDHPKGTNEAIRSWTTVI